MGMYLLVFGSAFLAATILPFYSEITIVTALQKGYAPAWIWLAGTSGNTLGAVVNWAAGRWLLHFKDRRWFPASQKQIDKAQNWFQKYGVWTLLLSWLPVGGDALTVIAGTMRVKLWIFVVLTAIGKGLRYLFVIGAVMAWPILSNQ